MRRMLALLTALALLALPMGALAEPRDTGSQLLDSIAELWSAAASAFGDAFEAARDDEALKSAWDALGARLKGAWGHVDERLADLRSSIRAGAERAGRSMGAWLDEHSADIDSIAQQAGEGLGEMMNGLSGALNSVFD